MAYTYTDQPGERIKTWFRYGPEKYFYCKRFSSRKCTLVEQWRVMTTREGSLAHQPRTQITGALTNPDHGRCDIWLLRRVGAEWPWEKEEKCCTCGRLSVSVDTITKRLPTSSRDACFVGGATCSMAYLSTDRVLCRVRPKPPELRRQRVCVSCPVA